MILKSILFSLAVPVENINPCQPSPCGSNSQCREVNGQAVCSCLPTYLGSPPGCRPECVLSSECPQAKSCDNQKCIDPCPGICGTNAICRVNNHSPICSCTIGFTGDPFTRCYLVPRKLLMIQMYSFDFDPINYKIASPAVEDEIRDPCYPSPCGPYSKCRNSNGIPSCSCLSTYVGNPPNCKPECNINSECMSNKACIREKCIDPCPGSCGLSARCSVINHTPICTCPEEYIGDPFTSCRPAPPPRKANISTRTKDLLTNYN